MKINDSNTPLHLLEPEYSMPYGIPQKRDLLENLFKVINFLEEVTPSHLVDKKSNSAIKVISEIDENTGFPDSDFRLTSYEWGVTYTGLIRLGNLTGNNRFTRYAEKRLKMISDLSHFYMNNRNIEIRDISPVYSVLYPSCLDDAGAICSAMLEAKQSNLQLNLNPLIENFINFISSKQYRLEDGTLARNRPYPNTLWLDDLYMSVPAMAMMGKITNEQKYFDDAVRQVLHFYKRMFVREKGLYFHGFVESMEEHPKFFWGRANGWAVMALVELLCVLPKNHSSYQEILEKFRNHVNGLISFQSGSGFWNQLLDRNDSYLETSATAIFTYAITKAINEGLIDKMAFAPAVILSWNALMTKINSGGQIEGTCVGTGMGFDFAFYYHRPVKEFAAHSYGPLFLAGTEILKLLSSNNFNLVEGSLQLI